LSNNPEGFDDALQHGATECIAKWRITPRDLATEVHSLVRRSDEF